MGYCMRTFLKPEKKVQQMEIFVVPATLVPFVDGNGTAAKKNRPENYRMVLI